MGVPDRSPRPPIPPGPYLVVGLARSGVAAARLLAGRGERVIGIDSAHPEGAEGLEGAGVEVVLDVDGTELVDRARCLVKSPGVPDAAPAIAAARARGVPVLGELELGWRLLPNRFCAVTGTNGKTTVTELLGHIWRTAGEPVAVAGNVGTPLDRAGRRRRAPSATVVCEASSFQLEDAEAFAPECGVLLNVSPRPPRPPRHASRPTCARSCGSSPTRGPTTSRVYDGDDPLLAAAELGGCGRDAPFCRDGPAPAARRRSARTRSRLGGEPLLGLDELALPGAHNVANAIAAAAAALAMGVDREAVAAGLRELRRRPAPPRARRRARWGRLRQRLEGDQRRRRAARRCAPSTAASTRSSAAREKGESFADARRGRGRALRRLLSDRRGRRGARARPGARLAGRGRLPPLRRTCAAAVAAAAAAARPGEVVLLSPACASFDAYPRLRGRGEHFRALVEGLR